MDKDKLARMWCMINARDHKLSHLAMRLIEAEIGSAACMQMWRKLATNDSMCCKLAAWAEAELKKADAA